MTTNFYQSIPELHQSDVINNNSGRRIFNKKKARWFLIGTFVIATMMYSTSMKTFRRSLSEVAEIYVTSHRRASSFRKPIMFTFYNPKDPNGRDFIGDQALLQFWTEKWNEAGWDARILTLDDAKKHPRFDEFEEKLNGVPLNGMNEVYNRLCFYRWLAVAAVGGGWMSDMDVLPLNFPQPDEYFKDGRFAIYSTAPGNSGGIPCLMSGSASEWERLAFSVVENAVAHQNEYFWSDMFASIDIYQQNRDSYDLLDLMGEVMKVDWDEDTCNQYNNKLAAHFSHSAVHKIGLHDINLRSTLSNDWLNEWRASCKGYETVEFS